MDYKEAFEKASKFGQEHIFQFWDELSKEERESLLKQVNEIDFDEIESLKKLTSKKEKANPDPKSISAPNSIKKEKIMKSEKSTYEQGVTTLKEGKVACLMVAGGQGSRLGFEGPKGCFPISPVENKTLFQLFAEQILANQKKYDVNLQWYMMTSVANNAQTKEFFEENNYFGLDKKQIHFFVQKMLPAINKEGKFFLKTKSEIFTNPNGTGGVYSALKENGILDHAKKNNIEFFSFVNVDNPLVEIFDPAHIGLVKERNSDYSIKVVKKTNPEEKVGLICNVNGITQVLEYSNISEELTHEKNEENDLLLNLANLNILIIKRDFIEQILKDNLLEYVVAFKKIPFISESGELFQPDSPNGYKFETFVFDVMPLTKNISIIEDLREDIFAPVKNAEGVDSPLTARLLMNRKAKKWMLKAGFDKEIVDHIDFAEISPLFALTEEDFIEKVENKIEFYENEMIAEENFYFQ
ncbi:UTP--glucose-1-phosphate uridylyltransferase [Candidatus Woesearchaeota archaeon]|nr:UTP--glucose-1-phosphate uridylyltransferase [Candidatus Woesearchaeota archaeon]